MMPQTDAVRRFAATAALWRLVAATDGKRWGAAAGVCLALFVACLAFASGAGAASAAKQDRLTFSERISLPYGGQVQQETAELTACMQARLAVIAQAQAALAGLTAVRFGLDDPRQLAALTDTVLPPIVVTLPEETQPFHVTAQADVFVPMSTLPEAVQAVLARSGDLELRAEALAKAGQLATEAGELILQSAGQRERGQPDDPFSSRLAYLTSQLRATTRYMRLLDQFGGEWNPPAEAEVALSELLRRDPDNALINLGLAEVLLRLDRPHEALRFASEALRLDPELARALHARGLAQLRLGLSALAVADFSQALALRPDKASWWRARGAAHMTRHEDELMCADLYQACTLGDCEGLAEVRGQGLCAAK